MGAVEQRARAGESQEYLRQILPVGTDIYSVVRSVSQSGMSRKISFFVVDNGDIRDISWHVANVLDYRVDPNNFALKVGGAGMDMCFHVVYSLGRALFGDRERERANDSGVAARDAGYAFNSRTL